MKYFISICSYCILFTIILLMSCSSNKNIVNEQPKNTQNDIIKETIENNFNNSDSLYIILNEEKTCILYLSEKKETSVNPVNNINFFVFDKSTNKIIYQNKFSNAKLKWFNNEQLLLTRYYGIIDTPESSNIKNFIIDLHSKEIQEIKEEKNKSTI